MEVAWIARKHHIGQRSTVCSRNDKKAEQEVGNQDEAVDSLPSTNR